MKVFHFASKEIVPGELEQVFAFFANGQNLELLTPAWLHFEILTRGPIEMRKGTEIDYRLKLHGFPLQWRSEITVWDPPRRFVDVQRRGPYRRWVHEHQFSALGENTVIYDNFEYAVYGGKLVQRLFVAPDLKQIFAYRREKLREALAGAMLKRRVSASRSV